MRAWDAAQPSEMQPSEMQPSEQRALRFIALLLFLQRASYLVPQSADVVLRATDYRDQALNAALVAVAVAWNATLALQVRKHGWFPRWTVVADVALTAALLGVSTMNTLPHDVFGHVNWPSKLGMATAALAGAALSARWAVLVPLVPVTLHFAMAAVRTDEPPLPPDGHFGVVEDYYWMTLIGFVVRRYLSAQGRALDEKNRLRLAVEARRAADQARFAERIAQYRALHDTVLTTLTAIARGGLDHRTDEVRARCAAEADYVRRLITEDRAGTATTLSARLAEVVAAAEVLGLRVRYRHGPLPAELPRHVVDAIADATREALNNVLAHSGTREAWVTALWEDGTLLTRVVDRGRGFDQDTVRPGFGLRSSVVDRMAEAGGEATVFGVPDNGVCVDLTWSIPEQVRAGGG
jgi:signal transduction histidine kinase